ncbi:MAG: hypothetical protein E6H55_18005, partial [Betaproteobacteria bacterium]
MDELVGGANPVPLKLFPEYELMQQARGVKAAAPTDLFYPDLSPRAPKIASAKAVTPKKLPSYLVKQRRLFQRGLLAWLRGDEEGARVMRDAVQGIEDVQTHSAQRSFWWTVGALLESIVEKGVESGFGVKQLCGRIDLQIRRFVEGSAKVADRMRREVLYYVAISAPVGPQVQAVQRAYRLPGLIPSADVLSADVVRVQPHLREARDLLATAKDLWLKLTGGRVESLPKLRQTLSALRDKTAAIGEPSLSKLSAALADRLDKLPSGPVSEAVAMEYATGLLLAESGIENYATASPELPRQVDAMIARLDTTRPAVGAAAPLLDEMARRAQERLLLAQVAREIQANLRHMEQVLDAFFRDHDKRADLATLAHDSKQIMGALKMLGLEHAEQLLTLCQQQIDEYAQPEAQVADEDLELQQQRPDRDRLIEPLLAKRLGLSAKPHVDEHDTVEAAVTDLKAALPATLAAFQRSPGEASVRERLEAELTTLKNDAELTGDETLQADAGAALELLAHAGTGDTAALQDAISAIAEGRAAAPAPSPSEETMRLLETDATQFDAELLDIYLTEADEVLDSVASNANRLRAQPDDRDALTTVRRGFHTLKGSGRMVGLTELGEIAFAVEKVHNRLMEDERPASAAVLGLIETAQTSFRVWVDTLRRKGRVTPDATALHTAIEKVEAELPAPSISAAAPPIAEVDAAAPMEEAPVPAPAAPTTAPKVSSAPVIEVIELDETLPAEPSAAAGEPQGAAVSAEIIEFAPREPPAPRAIPPTAPPESMAKVEPEEVTIGDVTLSSALYRILCDEAQQHLATLDAEMQSLQFDTAATPSQAMVRASHTLCGIHRTGGFPLVATTAKALEQCLLGLEERGAPLPYAAQPVLARAIAGLHALTARVRARSPFNAADQAEAAEIVAELEALRHEAAPTAVADDSESLAARVAAEYEARESPAATAAPLTTLAATDAQIVPITAAARPVRA